MPIKHSGNPDRVREICRQLKPILGEKMEQVFQAYLAEDETGKQQLEAYLELLQAKHMPVRLDAVATQLVPPNPAQAYGEYELGTVLYGGKTRGTFGVRENEWIQHVGIFGRTGAGKTNLGFKIVEELVKHGKPVLVLDWKRNYRDLLTNPLFKDAKVYTIGRSIAPFTFNPLIPPPGTKPKTWLKKLDEVIAHSYMLGNGVLYLLQQTLDQLYEEFGVYDGTVHHTIDSLQTLGGLCPFCRQEALELLTAGAIDTRAFDELSLYCSACKAECQGGCRRATCRRHAASFQMSADTPPTFLCPECLKQAQREKFLHRVVRIAAYPFITHDDERKQEEGK